MNTVTVIRNPNTATAYPNVPLGGGTTNNNTYLNGVTGLNNLTGLIFITGGGDTTVSVAGQVITVYTAAAGVATSGLISTGNADLRYYLNTNPSGYLTGFNSGQYATVTDLQSTGSTLDNKINSLSGFVNDTVVYKTGDQNIIGLKTFNTGFRVSGDGIDLLNISNPIWTEGRVFYDNTEHTLSYYNDATGITVNIAQEEIVRVINNHGSTITDGQVVYIDSAQGNRPAVKLAIASNENADKVIGVVTHDIPNNNNGYITVRGIVRNFNTSSYSVGDVLYLSPTISGALTNVEPIQPNHLIKIGLVLNSHATQGSIFVNPIHISYDLHHLHDVYFLTGNLNNNDLLSYNLQSGKWLAIPNFSGVLKADIASTGDNLQNQINTLSNNTGNYYQNSNPSGYITGFNSGQYATVTNLELTGTSLQNQVNNINNGTGNFISSSQTGQFYPASNPQQYATSGNLSSYSTTTYVQTGFVPKLRYNSFSAPAGSFAPLASGGATATSFSITNTHYLDAYSFDAASEQGITLQFSLPDTYNNGSLKSKLFWGVASGGISGVVFGISALAYVSGNTLNQSFGPETLVSGYASASGIVFQNTSNVINLTGFISGSSSLVLMKISRKVSDAGDVCSKAALLYNTNIQWQETGVEPSIWS